MTYSHFREREINKKNIDLRWIHQFEDGPIVVRPDRDFFGEEATLKDCEIRWYRYKLGAAAADEYCGVYWTGLTVSKIEGTENNYLLSEWDGKTKKVLDYNSDGTVKVDKDNN
jgi:hypothetical protein